MINIQSVLISNGSAILLIAILLFSSHKTIHRHLPDDRLFRLMLLSTIAQCIVESSTFLIDGKSDTGLRELSIALNTFLFINNISFAFIWTLYADYKIFGDSNRLKRIYPLIAIPAILVDILTFVNIFYPIFFTVSATNIYERTTLFFIPYLLTYLYLSYGLILIYANRKKTNKVLFLPAIIFMIPIFIASAFQFVFYGLSLIWLGVAIALTSLYINVQNEVSFTDPLSGLFTRQYMNHYLETLIRHSSKQKLFAGIMLDIDHFKSINDKYGHLTGDDAIHSAGIILRSCFSDRQFICRFAGDEFIILLNFSNKTEITNTIQKIQATTEKFNAEQNKDYSLKFSMGYDILDPEKDTVDSFLGRIDHAMYKNKKSKN